MKYLFLKNLLKIKKRILNDENLYSYDDLPNIIEYSDDRKNYINTNCHLGQRKLLLTEIEFFSRFIPFDSDNIVIYAGSASCEHLPIILDMFPRLKFILIDPNYHLISYKYNYIYQNSEVIEYRHRNNIKKNLKERNYNRNKHLKKITKNLLDVSFLNYDKSYNVLTEIDFNEMKKIKEKFFKKGYKNLLKDIKKSRNRVFIIQDYLTLELTKLLSNVIKDCYFLSDIRTNLFTKYSHDLDILWNSSLQTIYLKNLKPKFSMLKFRPPYLIDYNDNIFKNYKDNKYKDVKKDFDYVKKKYKIDFIKNYDNKKFMYFKSSHILLQAWAPRSSGEARLIISRKNIDSKFVHYDETEWSNKFYYFKFYRQYGFNSISNGVLDYNGSYDSMRELMIICNYYLYKKDKDYKIDMNLIKKFIKNNILKIKHIYKKINKYIYYNLKNNSKCIFNNNKKKEDFIVYVFDQKLNKYKITNKITLIDKNQSNDEEKEILKKIINLYK